jgi:type II secretion system protein H
VSQSARGSGFTLIEVLVTVALLGVMMTFAVFGWSSWARSREQSGTARELQSFMRQAQQRAVTEGRAMCVRFDVGANSYTLFSGACGSTPVVTVRGPVTTGGAEVHITSPVFTGTSVPEGVTFYARGTATPGTVQVTRSDSSKVYTLGVEGLTGRVSLS